MNVAEFCGRVDAIAGHESKWHLHPEAMRHILRFKEVKDFDEFSASLERGGTGRKEKVKGGSMFVVNPYGCKINLKGRQDNKLHLNYEIKGKER